ncbi:hypothetical protein CN681_09055 [Bacillus toyonensis]|nr:hypothetical protein CN681_09055 [Bacillus toyonensis]PGA03107.1 hypothetical protein COL67_26255 [Bacillus toyonensis]PGA57594.1 hypothetical protein COL86_06770 [Bacillus toyonensis]PGB62483.1 hypothetical protein COM00_12910 [Bacillus toyonensis]PGC04760.1 hypothetical protein COM19_02190 [Bacillus toyonensis]
MGANVRAFSALSQSFLSSLQNISAIFEIYRRHSKYISDFSNISAQLQIYQRFSKYIDLPTKNDTHQKPIHSIASHPKSHCNHNVNPPI